MDTCPACTASLTRDGKIHCTSPGCVWIKCGRCGCMVDNETGAYNRGGNLWGNPDGYLKAS